MTALSHAPAAPVTIHRGDYQPPDWHAHHVRMTFNLGVETTRVIADIDVTRNGAHDRPLVLDEDGGLINELTVDDAPVRWDQAKNAITVPISADSATVRIETTLAPAANTQLMGLYASNGMLCTQCEAEGFRRIIPFVDRPDNMAVYTVRLEGDKAQFPVLLANGEKVAEGDLENGQHFAEWHDPWPKPSYLFALVAGDLVANRDHFTTMSGKHVDLGIWVRDGDVERTHHAMQALKNSMKWDEDTYGREYDLSVFNIVAVSDFNMGAMENKGLNIFNTRYILADPDTATDMDFDGVEGVVAHEYFHNWSGNRVTCRDWFQLSLKEGFTVYRDQSFSADMGSLAVKRIEDVRMLRAAQFPEDNGPLAHPIRPDSYQEISNFYTATVYNKGAEVIRMMATMVGPERFRQGTDLYFNRHDGEAATCENFITAMENGAGADFSHFRLWYSQAGTPHVAASMSFNQDNGEAVLHLKQTVPPTPGQPDKQPMQIPLRIAVHDPTASSLGTEGLLLLDKAEADVRLGRFGKRPMLSFNRNFSAPIIADVAREKGELAWLAAHDNDPFARYEALQALMLETILAGVTKGHTDHDDVVHAVDNMLAGWRDDPAFIAEACMVPSEAFIGEQMLVIDPDAIRRERRALQIILGRAHGDQWRSIYDATVTDAADLSPEAKGQRKLHGLALMMYWCGTMPGAVQLAYEQFSNAQGMTDRQSALAVLAHTDAPERQAALDAFYQRYSGDPLVLDKWFTTQALSLRPDAVEQVEVLAKHRDFTLANPNRVRALYGAFAGNQAAFHRADGRGYELFTDLIIALDPRNAQTAARMVPPLGRWRRFDEGRAAKMRACLERIIGQPGLSRDTMEQASKSLAG